jgi:hypothetical protein
LKKTTKPGPASKPLQLFIKGMGKFQSRVGWFEGNHYDNGTPVAYVAAINEYGASFQHPGGTKYIMRDGVPLFVKDSYQGAIEGVTKPHNITIPARPTIRPTIAHQRDNWMKNGAKLAAKASTGNMALRAVFDQIGLVAAGDVRKTITQLTSPPLKAATIRARQNSYANKKVKGNLSKPLVASSQMVSTLTNQTTEKG